MDSVGRCGLRYLWNLTSHTLTVTVCFLLDMGILYIECEFVYPKNMPFSVYVSNLLPEGRCSLGM